MKFPTILFLFFLFILTACSSHNVEDYPRYSDQVARLMQEKKNDMHSSELENSVPDLSNIPIYMAPGHLFTLSHPSDNKLSGTFRADFNGRLELPYDVVVDVNNRTFPELKEIVMKSYTKFFQRGVESVNFSLSKKDFWVEVRGLVKKPGRYLIRGTDSLDLVVDTAGGVQGDVSVDYFTANIKQGKFDYQVLLNKYFESTENVDKIRWLGGDNIFVSKLDSLAGMQKEIPFVTIIGGVTKPGKVLYQKDASLFYFIEKAGGALQGMGYDECYIFRNTPTGVRKIQFAFNQPETIPVIMPNDTIYMNSQVKTAGDQLLERLSHIAGLISTVALLIIAL